MDIRAERTRALLRDAFEDLLEEEPFEAISVSEICARSTVRRATFYRHFEDKNAFFEWYLSTITDRFVSELSGNHDELGLREYVELMHRKLVDFLEMHRNWFMKTMGRNALAGSLDMIMEQVAIGVAQHVDAYAFENGFALDAEPEFISLFYTGGMVHTLRYWMLAGKPFPVDDLVEGSTEFLMRYVEGAVA